MEDRELVITAVRQNPAALRFASWALQRDENVLSIARAKAA